MLYHVHSIGSCSQFCSILQPHRVAVPFSRTFASSWRNSFVEIHGWTTLLKAKFGATPQKRPKNDLIWGVGSLVQIIVCCKSLYFVVVVSILIQLNPRAQNVSRPWREPQRRYKSELRSSKHESPHRTIEAPHTPRSRGGGRANAVFMPPRTIKILGEGRPRGPRRVHADAHIDTQRGNQSFRITRPDYWCSETTRHR